jgi:hypothetical protein
LGEPGETLATPLLQLLLLLPLRRLQLLLLLLPLRLLLLLVRVFGWAAWQQELLRK